MLKHIKNIDSIFVFLVLIHFRCKNDFCIIKADKIPCENTVLSPIQNYFGDIKKNVYKISDSKNFRHPFSSSPC